MLKYIVIAFFLSTTISCSTAFSQDAQESIATKRESVSAALSQALALAEQAQDYRLLVTATRGINVPGLEQSDIKSAVALCGKKYMLNTGDVIKTEQDRIDREKVIVYMRQYNEKMWLLCQGEKVITNH